MAASADSALTHSPSSSLLSGVAEEHKEQSSPVNAASHDQVAIIQHPFNLKNLPLSNDHYRWRGAATGLKVGGVLSLTGTAPMAILVNESIVSIMATVFEIGSFSVLSWQLAIISAIIFILLCITIGARSSTPKSLPSNNLANERGTLQNLVKPASVNRKRDFGQQLARVLYGVLVGLFGGYGGYALGATVVSMAALTGSAAVLMTFGMPVLAGIIGFMLGAKLADRCWHGNPQGLHVDSAIETLTKLDMQYDHTQQARVSAVTAQQWRDLLSIRSAHWRGGASSEGKRQAIRVALIHRVATHGLGYAYDLKKQLLAATASNHGTDFQAAMRNVHPWLALLTGGPHRRIKQTVDEQNRPIGRWQRWVNPTWQQQCYAYTKLPEHLQEDSCTVANAITDLKNGPYQGMLITALYQQTEQESASENLKFLAELIALQASALVTDEDRTNFILHLQWIRDKFVINDAPWQINLPCKKSKTLMGSLGYKNLSNDKETLEPFKNFGNKDHSLKPFDPSDRKETALMGSLGDENRSNDKEVVKLVKKNGPFDSAFLEIKGLLVSINDHMGIKLFPESQQT